MIKAPIDLQDLRRRIYAKAKAEPSWRFWGLYVHVCKIETLQSAYKLAKENNGAPGIDGVTFEAVESAGRAEFLEQLREELSSGTYRPERVRRVGIPKTGGKLRMLSIPTIRDRVVQGALKLILEPIFEADFQPGSFGYRPKKSAHDAVQRRVREIGRRRWKKESGYHRQARVENLFLRYKSIIGDRGPAPLAKRLRLRRRGFVLDTRRHRKLRR